MLKNLIRTGAGIVFVFLTICAFPVFASDHFLLTKDLDKANTPFGLLKIRRFKANPNDILDSFDVMLAAKRLVRINWPVDVSISAVYPDLHRAKFILLEIVTAASGCPTRYKLIELKSADDVAVTGDFGNCNEIDGAIRNDKAWNFYFPPIPGDEMARGRPDVWVYKDGKMTEKIGNN